MRTIWILSLSFLALTGCSGSESGGSNVQVENPANADANSTPIPTPSLPVNSQNVTITSPDKVVIAASYFESSKAGSPAVVLLHQWESDRHSFDDFAARMQAKGFNVLSIDGRGFGESTKTADGKPVAPERTDQAVKAMLGDVDSAVNFLAKQKSVDPNQIGIVGASYGSSLALIYAANHPKVKSIALISPGLNYFGNMQTEPAVKAYGDRPLLMIAAEDDKESADAVRQLKTASGNDKYQAQTYQHGGHGTDIFKANVGLAETMELFLTNSLQKWPRR